MQNSEVIEELADSRYPEFLTAKYFEKILQTFSHDEDLKVFSVKIGPCGAPGDAFASTMFRVNISASQKNEMKQKRGNYVVKMMPTLQLAREKLGENGLDVHEKEMEIFQNVFPEMRNILKPLNEIRSVFPRAIAVDRVKGVLILEDLNDSNFVMADRKVGLDLNHLDLGLQKLARFHAASMILLKENPEKLKLFDIGMFSRKSSAFHVFISTNLDALVQEVSSWEGFELYAQKLELLKGDLLKNTQSVFDNKPGDMKVLIHGDMWVNNLMFNYHRNGKLKDCMIIDFQFCCVASPAVDLAYFLFTSPIDEIRQTRFFDSTAFYFNELKIVLQKLKFDMKSLPTLHEFQMQVMGKLFYAFTASMLILPLMMSSDPEASFENSHQANEQALAFKRRLYKNTDVQQVIRNSLPLFDRLGLLDKM